MSVRLVVVVQHPVCAHVVRADAPNRGPKGAYMPCMPCAHDGAHRPLARRAVVGVVVGEVEPLGEVVEGMALQR